MISIWNHYRKVVPTCEDLPSIQMWRQLIQLSTELRIEYCITSMNIASMSAPPISWLPHCDQHSRQSVTPRNTRVLPFSALHNNATPVVSLSLLPASWVLVQMTDSRWRLRKMFCACRECPLLSYYLLSSQARIMLNSSLVVPAPLPPLHQKKEQSFSACSECPQTFMYLFSVINNYYHYYIFFIKKI